MILCAVLAASAAYGFSKSQQPLYEAQADVLLSRQNLAAQLNSSPESGVLQGDADRLAATQVQLAHSPEVVRRVLGAKTTADPRVSKLMEASTVTQSGKTDILVFKVRDPVQSEAVRLSNRYAAVFRDYRRQLDTMSFARARNEVSSRLRGLSQGSSDKDLRNSLLEKEQQLRTIEALQTSNAIVFREASEAAQIRPRPTRNAIIGLVLGILGGLMMAFARDALDTRLRSAQEISTLLDLPLLARIPAPSPDHRRGRLVLLTRPSSAEAEPYRLLRTSLQFSTLDGQFSSVMITSALPGEGKSTTVANLAIALALAGKRVTLVDLDLRRPSLHSFFDADPARGLTDVVIGDARLDEALLPVRLDASDGTADDVGRLDVLLSGPIPPDVGEFVSSPAIDRLFAQLAARSDIVLVDAPPILSLGDAHALSGKVDALIVMASLRRVRKPMLRELDRMLRGSTARRLGFILADAELDDLHYGYGYGYGDVLAGRDRPSNGGRAKQEPATTAS